MVDCRLFHFFAVRLVDDPPVGGSKSLGIPRLTEQFDIGFADHFLRRPADKGRKSLVAENIPEIIVGILGEETQRDGVDHFLPQILLILELVEYPAYVGDILNHAGKHHLPRIAPVDGGTQAEVMEAILIFGAVIEGRRRNLSSGEFRPFRPHQWQVFFVNPVFYIFDAVLDDGKQFRQQNRTGYFFGRRIEHEGCRFGNFRSGFLLGMSITQEIALGVFLGNIAEYQNRTENLIVRPENRRRAVGNVISCPILGEQVGVVGELDDYAGPQCPHHR